MHVDLAGADHNGAQDIWNRAHLLAPFGTFRLGASGAQFGVALAQRIDVTAVAILALGIAVEAVSPTAPA